MCFMKAFVSCVYGLSHKQSCKVLWNIYYAFKNLPSAHHNSVGLLKGHCIFVNEHSLFIQRVLHNIEREGRD